jgi:hypothetical protein
VYGFPQAEAVCRGYRDLVMQVGDSGAETAKPGPQALWLGAGALALPLLNRHMLRQPMQVRLPEQLLQ